MGYIDIHELVYAHMLYLSNAAVTTVARFHQCTVSMVKLCVSMIQNLDSLHVCR